MIALYKNQAEKLLAELGYNDYAQLFDLHPLIIPGNFHENSVSEVPWIYHRIISFIKQFWERQLSFRVTLLAWLKMECILYENSN